MKQIKALGLFLYAVVFGGLAFGQIVLVADEWCPYNCEPGDAMPGVLVEAATTILGAAGLEVKYELTDDWDAALEATREGKFDGVVGAAHEDAPDFIFPDEEMAVSKNAIYVRKGDAWRYAGVDSLEGKTAVGITSYSYGEEVDEWMEEKALYVDSLEQAVEALLGGKADVLFENEYVMSLFALQNHLGEAIESAGELESDIVYVAFSPAIAESKGYAEILAKGLKEMKADGSWKALLQKYGLDE